MKLVLAKQLTRGFWMGVGIFLNVSANAQTSVPTLQPPLLNWTETAEIEHMDRMNRLKRLSDRRYVAQPEFHEYLISKNKLPQFGIDIPVLRVVFSQSVFFDTDKDVVRPEAVSVLALVAETLRRDVPDVAVFIAGHTDSRGTDEYNYGLSVRRADSVARELFSQGVGLARMWRVGFGESVPMVPNTSDQNMARNRRVEFLISAKPQAPAAWLADQPTICGESGSNPERVCRLVAIPILRPSPTTVSPKKERETVAVPPIPSPAISIGDVKAEVETKEQQKTITIGRTDPIIIDLHDRRIEVGRPEL